jgi:hypothetical protein
MSKPRKKWWGYVRQILYAYPQLNPGNDTERREKAAVEAALEELEHSPEGEETGKIVAAVFFTKTHTLTGAAMRGNISYRTARRRQNEFILRVGKHMGLL